MSEAIAQPQSVGFLELAPREAAQRTDLTVVDVRGANELTGELGHIPGAQHLPLDHLIAFGPPSHWDADTPLLLVCRSGARSARAAMQLATAGFTGLHNLAGGMIAWHGARLPVTRERPRLRAAAR
jgi:sulfur-carrier protein adenylyltransferase/sulfurtransferase